MRRAPTTWSDAVRWVVLSIVVGLVAVGCGGSDADQSAQAPAATPVAAVVASPLENDLGFASEPGRRQYQLIVQQQQADADIVQCMRSAGFFYAVGSAEDRFRSGAFVGDESREFASQNGLGITTSFAKALAADAAQAVPDAAMTNLDYVASLTPEQATEYDNALVGSVELATQGQSFEPAGCWGSAFTDILRTVAVIDEFEPQIAALNSRLSSDPRVLGFQAEWSECMTGSSYRFANETAMVDDVYARLLDIELVEEGGITRLASRDALDALIGYEQQVAVASFDCRQSFSGELNRLRFDYEREFLDDNRFRIAELQPGIP